MLPQFGLSEFLLLAIAALIVVGPKDLPLMMRRIGQWVGQAKRMANEFRGAFDDIARQAELDELRKEIEDLKKNNELEQAVNDLKTAEREINASVMSGDQVDQKTEKKSDTAEPKASEAKPEAVSDKTPEPAMKKEPAGE
ncbi:MAG: twin-arginine translocase subunit TatB [Ponticaulis sp.]|nr:twin-arginine translocase subunit TatB [Ponticaulis sp.]